MVIFTIVDYIHVVWSLFFSSCLFYLNVQFLGKAKTVVSIKIGTKTFPFSFWFDVCRNKLLFRGENCAQLTDKIDVRCMVGILRMVKYLKEFEQLFIVKCSFSVFFNVFFVTCQFGHGVSFSSRKLEQQKQ